MRKINNTLYELVKEEIPDMGMNVSQMITDDLIQKQKSGEATAEEGASLQLDRKAAEIQPDKSAPKPTKTVKASGGSKTGIIKLPSEVSQGNQDGAGTAPSATKKKKVVKKKKKVTKKKAKVTPEKTDNSKAIMVGAIIALAVVIAYFLDLI